MWAACVVFFQCVLLLGYFYSHLAVRKFGMHRYRIFHTLLILLPLLTFPGVPLQNILANAHIPLVTDVFLKLFSSIGLVFFVLSTISIISQSWLAVSELPQRLNPYALYSVSNIGSFLALLTYPFLFEYFFDLDTQLNIWRFAYLIFIVFYLVTFKAITCIKAAPKPIKLFDKKVFLTSDSLRERLCWFLLAAASSMLFLSVTNIITYEVAPCPLFWIIPLSIYLISFVLNFKQNPWCPSWIIEGIHFTLGFSAAFFFLTIRLMFPFLIYLLAYFISLFMVCMFCQHELYVTRPKEKEGLTSFYVVIAAGGFLGSMLITWIAPIVFFSSPLEYLLALLIVPLAVVIKKNNLAIRVFDLRWIAYLVLVLILWPRVFKTYNIFALIIMYIVFKEAFGQLKEKPQLLCVSLFSLMLVATVTFNTWETGQSIYILRNYYGLYKVFAKDGLLTFANGTTIHGSQFIAKKKQNEPLSYFHREAPVGRLIENESFSFQRIAVVGLGVGTLAAYGKPGQEIDFFELDPDVYKIANLCFTYLKNSSAKINCIFGDARFTLSQKPDGYYNLLIIDAFNGDSVPVHLLTVEAIQEYKKHLVKNGIILFHISSRYLDFIPVLFSNAKMANANVSFDENSQIDNARLSSTWAAMTWDRELDNILSSKLKWKKEVTDLRIKKVRPWTDKYSNIATIIKINNLINQIKSFTPFYW